jgi:hypothetical protein
MASSFFTTTRERMDGGAKSTPTFRTATPKVGMQTKTYRHPPSPGTPRKIFKPFGKRIKRGVAGDA